MPDSRETGGPARRIAIAFGVSLLTLVLGPRAYPAWVGERLTQATAAAAGGHPAASLEAVSQVLEFEPALAALHLAAARLALQAGDAGRAGEHVTAARDAGVPSGRMECLEVELRLAAGTVPTGFSQSESSCLLESPDPEAWVAATLEQGDLQAARRMLTLLVGESPEATRRWERLAALVEILDPASTEAVVRRALAANPQGSALLDALFSMARQQNSGDNAAERAARVGREFAAAGDWTFATAAWRWAVEQEPEFPRARAFLGYGLDQQGQDGLPHLSRAAAEAPDDPLTRALLGRYWLAHQEPDLARRELVLAHHLAPYYPAISASLGAALASLGRYPEAAQAYLEAAEIDPSDPALWLMLAEFSVQHGYQVETLGLPAARNAAALVPSPPALSPLGFATSLAGQPLLGERLLVRSLARDPWNPGTWYRLGLTRLDLGDVAGAHAALAQAVHLDPQGAIGRLAERTMETVSE